MMVVVVVSARSRAQRAAAAAALNCCSRGIMAIAALDKSWLAVGRSGACARQTCRDCGNGRGLGADRIRPSEPSTFTERKAHVHETPIASSSLRRGSVRHIQSTGIMASRFQLFFAFMAGSDKRVL